MALNIFRKSGYASENEFEKAALHISDEGNNFLFIFRIKGKYFVQSKDKIYGGFDSVEKKIFRKNGKIFAFKASTFSKKLGLIKEENQDSLIINKRILGPFNKIHDYSLNDNITFYLWHEILGDTYLIVNNNKYGSFRKIYNVAFSSDGSSFAFCYKSGSKKYVRINDVISEPYDDLSDFILDYPSNFTGYIFRKNEGEYFVKINNRVQGPFESVSDLHYYKEYGHYTYNYSKDKTNYYQINDSVLSGYDKYVAEKINRNFILIRSVIKTEAAFRMSKKETTHHAVVKDVGLFSNVTDHKLSSTGDSFIFSYFRGGQYYVVTGEYEYGPYKSVSNLMISSGGENYCFVYQKQFDNFYININGDIFGPYVSVSDVVITNSASSFGFIFMKNAKYFVNISNNLHGMYDAASNLKLSENGSGYVYKFSKRQKTGPLFSKLLNFISFNGEIVEEEADIIDYQTNSIGIEAIIFKRDNSWFINLNDTLFGPFDNISEWRFLPDETLFAFKYRDKHSDIDNLQINGKKYLSRDKNLKIYIPIFSNDRKKYGFIHYSDTHYYVQICNETFGPYENADFPSFSPDSGIFIFRYENSKGVHLNINGMEMGPFGKAEYTFHDGKLFITYLQEHMLYTDEITWQY